MNIAFATSRACPYGDAAAVTAAIAAGGLAAEWRRAARLADDLAALTELAHEISHAPDPRPAVGELARERLHADAVIQFARLERELVSSVVTGHPLGDLRIAADGDSVPARALREQRLIFAGARRRRRPALDGVRSGALLAVPVTRGAEPLGLMVWLWERPRRRLSAREEGLAQLLASIKAVLVGHWEQLVETEDRARAQVRTAVAQELEDSLSNDMAVLRMCADTAAHALTKDPTALLELIPLLSTHAIKAGEEVGTVLRALRRVQPMTDLGLADVIGPAIADFRRRCPATEIDLQAAVGRAEHVVPAIREAVFFVLSEALDNTARHADAARVAIELRAGGDGVVLSVRDDGRGFELGSSDRIPAGLLAMRERGRAARGEVDVHSVPGRGTRVTLQLPPPR
jgi:signal transduction histidine kinase